MKIQKMKYHMQKPVDKPQPWYLEEAQNHYQAQNLCPPLAA